MRRPRLKRNSLLSITIMWLSILPILEKNQVAYLYSRPCFAFYGELMFVREPKIIKFYRFTKNLTLNNIEEYGNSIPVG